SSHQTRGGDLWRAAVRGRGLWPHCVARIERADLAFEIAPFLLAPAVGTGDPGGGTGIDPAIQRLVAFAELLPFEPLKPAPGLHRHQLFGDELLAPLAVGPSRQVDGPCGKAGASGTLLVGRPLQPEVAIGLGLEGRDRHRPQPRAAPQSLAAGGRIDIGRPGNWARPVETLDPLDRRHLSEAGAPGPAVDSRRLETGVDREA